MVSGQLRVWLVGVQGAQGRQQVFARIGSGHWRGDNCPIGVMCAGAAQAVGHIGEIQIGMGDQVLVQPVGLCAQRRGGARRNRPQWPSWQPKLNTVIGLRGRGCEWSGGYPMPIPRLLLIPHDTESPRIIPLTVLPSSRSRTARHGTSVKSRAFSMTARYG